MNKARTLTTATLVSLATVGAFASTNTTAHAATIVPTAKQSRVVQTQTKETDALTTAKANAAKAKQALDDIQNHYDIVQGNIDRLLTIQKNTTPEKLQETQAKLDATKTKLDTAEAQLATAQKAVETAQTALSHAKQPGDNNQPALDQAKQALATANQNLHDCQTAYADAYNQYSSIRVSRTQLGNLEATRKDYKAQLEKAKQAYNVALQKVTVAEQALSPSHPSLLPTEENYHNKNNSSFSDVYNPEDSGLYTSEEPAKSAVSSKTPKDDHATSIALTGDNAKDAAAKSGHILPQTDEQRTYPAKAWGGALLSLLLSMLTLGTLTSRKRRHN